MEVLVVGCKGGLLGWPSTRCPFPLVVRFFVSERCTNRVCISRTFLKGWLASREYFSRNVDVIPSRSINLVTQGQSALRSHFYLSDVDSFRYFSFRALILRKLSNPRRECMRNGWLSFLHLSLMPFSFPALCLVQLVNSQITFHFLSLLDALISSSFGFSFGLPKVQEVRLKKIAAMISEGIVYMPGWISSPKIPVHR